MPLLARDRWLGVFSIVSSESGRTYDERDLDLVLELARRAALAVDNARLYEQARHAARLREEILAVVSHDLKNPLSTVIVSAGLLQRRLREENGEPERTCGKHVEAIQRAARRMDHLIRDLLDLASIQVGRFSVHPKPEAVLALLAEAIRGHEPLASEKGVRLGMRDDPAVELLALCDADRFMQVMSNLLGNAIKFCRAGDSITVAAERAEMEVVVSVEDTGPGIAPDALAHVFDPYWSAPDHAKTGTGLGLYISRNIVETQGASG